MYDIAWIQRQWAEHQFSIVIELRNECKITQSELLNQNRGTRRESEHWVFIMRKEESYEYILFGYGTNRLMLLLPWKFSNKNKNLYLLTLNDLSGVTRLVQFFFAHTEPHFIICTTQKSYDSIFIVQNSNYIRHVSNINFRVRCLLLWQLPLIVRNRQLNSYGYCLSLHEKASFNSIVHLKMH